MFGFLFFASQGLACKAAMFADQVLRFYMCSRQPKPNAQACARETEKRLTVRRPDPNNSSSICPLLHPFSRRFCIIHSASVPSFYSCDELCDIHESFSRIFFAQGCNHLACCIRARTRTPKLNIRNRIFFESYMLTPTLDHN